MSNVYVYEVDLPRGVNEAVTPGAEDDYTIYIDAGLSDARKLMAYYHALKHCTGDFDRINVQEIELNAHNRR